MVDARVGVKRVVGAAFRSPCPAPDRSLVCTTGIGCSTHRVLDGEYGWDTPNLQVRATDRHGSHLTTHPTMGRSTHRYRYRHSVHHTGSQPDR